MTDLKKYLDETSKYVKLGDGDSYVGVFDSWKVEKNEKFKNPDGSPKESFVFKFKDGKTLSTTSRSAALVFSTIEPETKIRIIRSGTGTSTKYIVTKE